MSNNVFSSNKPYLFRAILDWLLDNDATPYILVDVTKPFVEIPQEHVKDGQIVLNVNPSAVTQWHADQDAISFSARFSGTARQIYVPMNALMAIYAQENGEGMAFPMQETESVEEESLTSPVPELKAAQPKEVVKENKDKVTATARNKKDSISKISHLRVIK